MCVPRWDINPHASVVPIDVENHRCAPNAVAYSNACGQRQGQQPWLSRVFVMNPIPLDGTGFGPRRLLLLYLWALRYYPSKLEALGRHL